MAGDGNYTRAPNEAMGQSHCGYLGVLASMLSDLKHCYASLHHFQGKPSD